MSIDIAIIREWAEAKVSRRRFATDYDLEVARHILANLPTPTMADIAWDDAVHVGLCAEHSTYGVVRMFGENNSGDILFLYAEEGRLRARWTLPQNLTPIPGTRLDLTPRRVDTCESPDPIIDDGDGLNEKDGTVIGKESFNDEDNFVIDDEGSVNDEAVSRPKVLTTEEDYENAPNGTVATAPGNQPWTKVAGRWHRDGVECAAGDMGSVSRQVMRWGWEE